MLDLGLGDEPVLTRRFLRLADGLSGAR